MGAGAIGNEVVKNLALIGIGTILLVDLDRVAPSNLTRCVLMREGDVGLPKADVVAAAAMALNPGVSVLPVVGDIEFDLGDAHLRDADVVVGCLDNAYARYVLNRRVRSLGRSWIDSAISKDAVQVTWLGSSGACYACSLGDATLKNLHERFSCTGLRRVQAPNVVPTTIVTSAMAGALVAQLAVGVIHRRPKKGSLRWTLFLSQARWILDDVFPSERCPFHSRAPKRPLQRVPSGSSASWGSVASELGLTSSAVLLLRHPLIDGFSCDTCGAKRTTLGPMGRIPQEVSVCDVCETVMASKPTTEVSADSRLAEVPLADFGYAAGDRLVARVGRSQLQIELAPLPGWRPDESKQGGGT